MINLPKIYSFCDTPDREITWECENDEYIVSCSDKYADCILCGFGKTPEDALNDLEKLIKRTKEFVHESEEEWWNDVYG